MIQSFLPLLQSPRGLFHFIRKRFPDDFRTSAFSENQNKVEEKMMNLLRYLMLYLCVPTLGSLFCFLSRLQRAPFAGKLPWLSRPARKLTSG